MPSLHLLIVKFALLVSVKALLLVLVTLIL